MFSLQCILIQEFNCFIKCRILIINSVHIIITINVSLLSGLTKTIFALLYLNSAFKLSGNKESRRTLMLLLPS